MFSTIVFGGTFDPPHTGHLALVEQALKLFSPERLIVLPSPDPPHKTTLEKSMFSARLEMARLTFENLSNVVVSDIESTLPKPSYTVKTLEFLANESARQPIALLIGSDSLQNFDSWYEYKRIFQLAHLIVYPRKGWRTQVPESLREFSERIHLLKCDFVEYSSTEIRVQKDNLHASVSQKVLDYILENGLYYS